MIILQEGVQGSELWAIAITAIVALSGFLIRDAYSNLKKENEDLRKALNRHIADDIDKHAEFDKGMNEVNMKILKEINAISLTLTEYNKKEK